MQNVSCLVQRESTSSNDISIDVKPNYWVPPWFLCLCCKHGGATTVHLCLEVFPRREYTSRVRSRVGILLQGRNQIHIPCMTHSKWCWQVYLKVVK